MKHHVRYLIAGIVLVTWNTAAFAQQPETMQEQPASKYILPGERNAIQMEVNLWGEVRRPGIYKVPSDIDLVALLSSAGGPTDYAKLKEIRLIRAYPPEGEARVLTIDVREYLETARTEGLPKIYPGDTVFVPGNFRRYFATGASITSTVVSILATLALIFERLERAGTI